MYLSTTGTVVQPIGVSMILPVEVVLSVGVSVLNCTSTDSFPYCLLFYPDQTDIKGVGSHLTPPFFD